ncbi:Hsp20/alpha crystallin family protein [Caproiciproducens sp.]|uniref:Hsp20/alpha crystallin family protein n=1 Tax=Caproiciproducens sp. TaxID=1954376 RepID=UPI00289DA9CF|nr:Hsp20/alpha crystallin family protein [Caproiciproducens sp.]
MMFDLMPFGRRENNLFNYFDNMEKNFFGDISQGFSTFRTDVIDNGDKYVLKAELPGFKKEDIKIDIEGDRLTVSAEHNDETEEKKDSYIRRERRYGSFARSFDISNIKGNEISAEYKDGILELSMPKLETTVPESRRIEVR